MEDHCYRGLEQSRSIELDLYLPKENLAFEYQGQHHFIDIYALGPKWYQKQRDEEKRVLCLDNNITLIDVPYWWDFEPSSLISTIFKHRIDIIPVPADAPPIPEEDVEGLPQENTSKLMHGEEWDGKKDLTGWSVDCLQF